MLSLILYEKRKGKPVFMCFADLDKAFDSANLNPLWSSLAKIGLSSKMLHILQSIYLKYMPITSFPNPFHNPEEYIKVVT